jgi:hypothetical protein
MRRIRVQSSKLLISGDTMHEKNQGPIEEAPNLWRPQAIEEPETNRGSSISLATICMRRIRFQSRKLHISGDNLQSKNPRGHLSPILDCRRSLAMPFHLQKGEFLLFCFYLALICKKANFCDSASLSHSVESNHPSIQVFSRCRS